MKVIQYPEAAPGVIPVPYTSHSQHILPDGNKIHHLYVPCNRLPNLPLKESNPREPTINRVVNLMKDTLIERPFDFVKFNNGITLVCQSLASKNEIASIEFKKGMGICNGGHTYLAIKSSMNIDANALVHLEVIELVDEEGPDGYNKKIVEIAEARNNNAQLQAMSQADQLGYYDTIKSYIDDTSLIVWHEGDSKAKNTAMHATLLIRMMKSLDPLAFKSFYNQRRKGHVAATSGGKKAHTDWMNDMRKYRSKTLEEDEEEGNGGAEDE